MLWEKKLFWISKAYFKTCGRIYHRQPFMNRVYIFATKKSWNRYFVPDQKNKDFIKIHRSLSRYVTREHVGQLPLTSGVYAGFESFVVIYNTKPFMTSISLSPTLTFKVLPLLMKFFSSTLSRAGSNSSATSSMSSGLPNERQSSRWLRKYLWFNDVICR